MALCVRLIKKKKIGILWLQSSLTVAVAVKYIYTLSRFIIYITMPLKMPILTDNGMFESQHLSDHYSNETCKESSGPAGNEKDNV